MAFQYPYSHHHMTQAAPPMDQGYFHQAPQAPMSAHYTHYDAGYDMTRAAPGAHYPYMGGYSQQVVPMPMPIHAPAPVPAPAEQAVTGGVSATLDYEIKDMAEFFTSMALGIMKPNTESHDSFKAFVSQVLSATRLPRATVILSLVYLSKRWAMDDLEGGNKQSSGYIYRMAVVSLLLANKFHDDNTFTNRSWSQATGIAVAELTTLEADWLKKISWSLHLDSHDLKGWHRWDDCWDYWVANSPKSSAASSPLVSAVGNSGPGTANTSRQQSPRFSMPVSPVSLSKPKPGSSVVGSVAGSYTVPSWYQGATSGNPVCVPAVPATFTSYFQQSFAPVGPPPQAPMHAPSIPVQPRAMPLQPQPSHLYHECKEGPIASYYNPLCDCAHCVFDPFPKHVVAC